MGKEAPSTRRLIECTCEPPKFPAIPRIFGSTYFIYTLMKGYNKLAQKHYVQLQKYVPTPRTKSSNAVHHMQKACAPGSAALPWGRGY